MIKYLPFIKSACLLFFVVFNQLLIAQTVYNNPCNVGSTVDWPIDGVCYAANTNGMTALYNPGTCNAGNRDDAWASFTGDGNNITVTYQPTTLDAVLHVFSATAPCSVAEVGCSDNIGNGVAETVTLSPSVNGQVYFVRIQRYNSNNNMAGCLSITSTPPGGGSGGDDCANADRVDCGDALTGESTTSNTNDATLWGCYAPILTPGGDHYYVVQWPDAAAGGTIRLSFTNVADANDTYMEVLTLGNSCSAGTCDGGYQMTIATGLFGTGNNFIEYTVGAGVADYYFVVDSQNDGIDNYDISTTCFATGIELDVNSACTPIPVSEPANQGYYQTWDGAAPPDTVTDAAAMSGTYTICENIYLENTAGWEWFKYFDVYLGECWTNPTNLTPDAPPNNNGFFNTTGDWYASVVPGGGSDPDTLRWFFQHSSNPAWGDGNACCYNCNLYTFCYDVNVDPACNEATGFQNGVSATDDGIGGGGGGSVNASNITIGSTSNTILPVNLLSFNAVPVYKNEKYSVILNWATSSEINNDFFTIERSIDGQNFEVITKINGAGNSNEKNNYFAVDENPHKGVSYYRLKQTDYNGEFEYFDMVAVKITAFTDFTLYPNPVLSELKVSFQSPKEQSALDIKIYNVQGTLVFEQKGEVFKGANIFLINTNEFAQGMYFLTLDNGEEFVKMKFIKD